MERLQVLGVLLLEQERQRNFVLLEDDTLDINVLKRVIDLSSNDTIYRCENYYENVIPNQKLSTFKSHFRMSPSTFEAILQQLAVCPELSKRNQNLYGGRTQICAEKTFLIVLWTLATPDSYRSVADRFNVTESSVYNCLNSVIKAINNNLAKMYIRWPLQNEKPNAARMFDKYGLQKVLGAIDGCHIPIKRPQENGNDYFNRKKFYSIVLQGICSRKLMFLDVDCSWPGSVHDARVFRTSDIYHHGEELCDPNYYIIGDAAYPCLPWLLSPFRNDGHLTRVEQYFNTALSKTRVAIENTYALLKGRFRRLRDNLDRNNIQIIAETIVACCVLHNICLLKDDSDVEAFIQEGGQGRFDVMLPMIRGNQRFDENIGFQRRAAVAQDLWNRRILLRQQAV